MNSKINIESLVRKAFERNSSLRSLKMLRDSDDSVVLLLHTFVMQLFFERDHISVVCHDLLNGGIGYTLWSICSITDQIASPSLATMESNEIWLSDTKMNSRGSFASSSKRGQTS